MSHGTTGCWYTAVPRRKVSSCCSRSIGAACGLPSIRNSVSNANAFCGAVGVQIKMHACTHAVRSGRHAGNEVRECRGQALDDLHGLVAVCSDVE